MATFSKIQTDVRSYLIDVPNATSNLINDWINKAVNEAEENHNFHHMRETHVANTVEDTRKLDDKPADWKQLREPPFYLRDDGSTREMASSFSETDMHRQYDEEDTDNDGDPEFLFIDDAEFKVYPFPDGQSDYSDGEYRVHVPYWSYSPELVNDADTNWFTDNARWYLTFQAAAEGFLFNRDMDQATVFFERAGIQFNKAKMRDKRSQRVQPRVLVPRPGVYGAARKPPRKL